MSEAEARPPRGAAATPPAAAPGGGGLPAILCTVTAAGAAVIAVLAQGSSDALLLTLLASLAILGVFFLLGTAAGHIRLTERVTDGELAAAMADELETAVLVTARDGTLVYANAAVARVLGRTTTGAASAIEAVLGGSPAAAEALYRLQRAAEAGQVRREEITAAAGEPGGSVPRCLSIEVRPYAVAGRERELGRLALWQIRDTSRERAREAEALTELHRILDGYDDMPVGLAVGRSDGTLQHVNATFARALGLAPQAGAQRGLKLADVLPADAAQLLAEHARARPGERAQLDLDLKREDGRALPARIVWSGAAAADTGTGALLLAALPREPERALEQAGEAEVRFSRFFESAPFGIATVGADGRITTANAAFARMILDGTSGLGEHASAVLCRAADANVRAAVEAGLAAALAGHASAAPIEITVGGAAGDSRTYVRRLYISPLVATHARDAAILYVVDATEQKALEEKYAQSQKMEAVGKLAGGIAHDFNNVLTAILGFSDLLLQTHRPGDPAHRDIMNIKNSANRAAGLVGQLLGFSRRQTQQNETLDLGETISSLAPMLGTSVGDTVKIKFEPSRDLWLVKADRSQITNVILNLAVNARDAMPGGGTLSIHARNVSERESQRLGEAGLPLGEYVAIEVADTGCGMTAEVMARMFEPFYTTKGVGKGTGLGLASVYGIVKQSGGFILAESEPGKGTTFRIYLPRVELEAREEPAPAPKERKKARPAADLTGTGRVLLVEDEDVVRSFAVRALRGRGYEVLEASTGAEALEVLESEGGRIDIVVSDVVMPEMDGPTLLKELRRRKPDLKIIFVSGYPNEAFQASIDENEQFAFLPKPFSLPQLAAKVKEELRR